MGRHSIVLPCGLCGGRHEPFSPKCTAKPKATPMAPQPEKADTVHVAWQLFNTCQEVERIRMVIEAYAKAGISGTVHDLEHHDMLTDALARRATLFGDLRIRIRS